MVRLFSGLSARFGEETFRLEEDEFIAGIIARNVVSAYSNAGWHREVIRFSNEALDIFGKSVPDKTREDINLMAAASAKSINPQP